MTSKRFDFVVVNVDTSVSSAEMALYAAAQQRQIREHWAPLWQADPTMTVNVQGTSPVAPGLVEVRLIKRPEKAGNMLGYHDQKPDGTPVIYVYVELAQSFGDPWTTVASHEVLEVLGDPRMRRCIEMDDGTIWDAEVCDRVEGDKYLLDGAWLSNFNTPECFEPPADLTGVVYDYLKLTTKPNQVRSNGGYAQERVPGKGWVQHGAMRGYRQFLADAGLGRGARRRARTKTFWQRVVGFFRGWRS